MRAFLLSLRGLLRWAGGPVRWWLLLRLGLGLGVMGGGPLLTAGQPARPAPARPAPPTPVPLRLGLATERDGLPAASSRSLLLDRAGFLWIGSEDGLARSDGRTFTTWRHRRGDSTTLPNDIVLTLAEDRAGAIWVGTHGGIGRLDPARQTFRTWRARPNNPRALPADYDSRVWVGAQTNTVWAATPRGLYRYYPAADQWRRHPLPQENEPAGAFVLAALEDRAGRFWFGARGRVWALDGRTGRLLATRTVPRAPGEQPRALTGFWQDAGGRVWAGAWGGGLVSLTTAAGALLPAARTHRWQPEVLNIGTTDIAYAAAETRDPRTGARALWVATERGLLRLRPRTGRTGAADSTAADPWAGLPAALTEGVDYDRIGADPDDPTPLAPINALLADPTTGRLWAGSTAGLRWHTPGPALFTTVPVGAGLPRLDPYHLRPDRDPRTGARQYWLSAWYGGLTLLDSALREVRTWPCLPIGSTEDRAGRFCDVVRSRVDGALWVATFAALVRFDPATGRTRRFVTAPADSASLPDSHAISLLEDRAGRLWVGTMRGVACLETPADYAAGHFRRLPQARNRVVLNLAEDGAGRVWLGTDDGLFCAPAGPRGPLRAYPAAPDAPHGLTHGHISSIVPQPDGRVWVATRDGLSVWRPATDDFAQFHSGQGALPVDNLYGALPDRHGYWWLLTPRGLVRARFPGGPFRLFDTASGLPQTDLDGILASLPDGRLVVGLNRRLIIVDPATIRRPARRPRVALTGVALFGAPVRLAQPLGTGPPLDFAPDEHTLTFQFAALDFADPKGNRCEYRLGEAADPRGPVRWQTAGPDGTATFARLPGGHYTLLVRARTADGRVSARPAVVRFRVRVPWWRTGWFGGGVLAAAGLALALYARHYRRRAERQAHQAREMAELELRALRAQLNPHFMFNALNAVQELVLTSRATDAGRYLARFARLLRLVLDGADRPAVALDTELDVLRLYADLEQLRLEGLVITFEVDPELLAAAPSIPPMVIQPYLENACWHGVAGRPPTARRVTVRLAFADATETGVLAQIEDTGIGRAAAATRQATAGRTAHGQRLTERRLALLAAAAPTAAALPPVRLTDLTDPATGGALGTRVEIWLPVG